MKQQDKFEYEIQLIKDKFNKSGSLYADIIEELHKENIEEKLILLNKAIQFSQSGESVDFMDDIEVYNVFLNEIVDKKAVDKFIVKNFEMYVPEIFYNEIMEVVKYNYKNNLLRYVDDIQLYFKKLNRFKLRVLKDCSSINTISNDYSYIYKNLQPANIKRIINRERKKLIVDCQVLLKLVGRDKREYTSKTLENEYKYQLKNNARFMLDKYIFNDKNKKIRLKDVIKTVEHKTAETLNTFKTIELLAEEQNLSPVFITITLPREKHPNPTKGKNSYDGTGIQEGARLLTEGFNNVRANLTKQKIEVMGVRVLEVHKDACFHCHALIFINKDNFEDLKKYLNLQFKNYVASDKNFIVINTEGSKEYKARKASSYIFKYITKATTYSNLNVDLNRYDVAEDSAKDKIIFDLLNKLREEDLNSFKNSAVRSFASVRSIQFFGLKNCLSTFRYLCRNKESIKQNLSQDLKNIINQSSLYDFVKFGFYSICKNIYIDTKKDERNRGYKKFMGVIVDNILYLKRLFTLISNKNLRNDISKKFTSQVYKVLVNHNYSRVKQKIYKYEEESGKSIKIFNLNTFLLTETYLLK